MEQTPEPFRRRTALSICIDNRSVGTAWNPCLLLDGKMPDDASWSRTTVSEYPEKQAAAPDLELCA